MKKRISFKKKYANGTGVNGYIPNPREVMTDYDIMLAKAEQKANENIGLKIVPIVSSLAQSFIKSGASGSGGTTTTSSDIGQGEGITPSRIEGNNNFNGGTFMSPQDEYNFLQQRTMAAFGMNNAAGEIEVEGKEVLETPNGKVSEIKGPSHEEGGVNVNVPKGTKIYSDRIKKFGDSMAERKVARENKKLRLEKLLEKNKTDKAIKNTYNRSLSALEKEEQTDLQTQEMFNNIMGMMEEFAYGTGNNGVQKYAGGTGEVGTDPYPLIKYGKGFGFQDFKPFLDTFTTIAGKTPVIDWEDKEAIKSFQKYIGTKPDGVLGKDSLSKAKSMFTNAVNTDPNVSKTNSFNDFDKDGVPDYVDINSMNPIQTIGPANEIIGNSEVVTTKPTLATNDFNSSIAGGNDTNLSIDKKTGFFDKAGSWVDKNLPNVSTGDMIGLFGDIYSAFKPMENTLENRAGDTPNINAFKDFGKDALKTIEESKGYIAGQRDNALQRNLVTSRGTKTSARNSARSVNTMRAFDTAADLNLMQADSAVMDNFAQMMMGILGQQASLENAQDQAVMTGEYQRDLADRQDRDNFYSQKAKDIATKGQGIQIIGKDINAIKQNQMMNDIINQLSKYGLGFDKNGQLIQLTKK